MRISFLQPLALLFLAGAILSTPATATPILTFTGANPQFLGSGNITVGWSFTVITPVTVTALGWYDSSQGFTGLSGSHQVGIWDSTGASLLTSATVPSGTAGTLDNGFRMVNLGSALLLSVGTYLIGGVNGPDDAEFDFSSLNITTDPRIAFGAPRTASNAGGQTGFLPPITDIFSATNGYFGPDFWVQPAQTGTPEPASLLLLAAGLAVVAWRRRRLP